ncbi:MAG: membrane protein insertion efficiency factor YidD [Pseudomonadales bacterium]|nr:membrane protein insertion efficiency factor YidD [Pseudomonadales bacterium]
MLNHIANGIKHLLLQGLLILVRFYQLFISPAFASGCRFYPSCSHYCLEALTTHGILKGSYLTVHRICRCHPGNPGGYDPVPEKHSTSKIKNCKKSCHNG